jgi:hypothetical protein
LILRILRILEAPQDRLTRPDRVWNRISDDFRLQIIDVALDESKWPPRKMAVRLSEEKKYFASEASVYRLPKAHNLIINPTFIVIMAAKEFFVDHYNHGRSRESLDNLTLSDVYFGRSKTILIECERIK